MCLGLPMTVVDSDDFSALCEWHGETRRVSTLLVGKQMPGARLLVHLDSAIRVLGDAEAEAITPSRSSLAATPARLDPSGTVKAVSWASGPDEYHPPTNHVPTPSSSRTAASSGVRPQREPSISRPP